MNRVFQHRCCNEGVSNRGGSHLRRFGWLSETRPMPRLTRWGREIAGKATVPHTQFTQNRQSGEAERGIDRWRLDSNFHRVHSSLEYQSPVALAGWLRSSGYGSGSRTQSHYQPQLSHLTWCKDWGVVNSLGKPGLNTALCPGTDAEKSRMF
jgi:hypothetical protein